MTEKVEEKAEESPIYFNRELSWLDFNCRVLNQARDPEYPLLERLKYLSFVSSNLDEFYEIRVAGLMQQVDSGIMERSLGGLTPDAQLKSILQVTQSLVMNQYECWRNEILPALKKEKIIFKSRNEISEKEYSWLKKYFEMEIFPVLTPLAIDFAHPFPQLTNKGLYILVLLNGVPDHEKKSRLAVIPVPRILPRVVWIKGNGASSKSYIFLSDILRDFAHKLFPGFEVKGAWEFRITRNSDLYINEEETENLLNKIEEELYNLRRGAAVRLEIRKGVDKEALEELLKCIGLSKDYTFFIDGPLNLLRLNSVYDLIERPDLKFPVFQPFVPTELSKAKNIFEAISKEDFLLHHPYDSFGPVINFVQQAAKDPQVFAIKQTLYRTSGDSAILEALKEASQNGKQVTTLIELKARFDEENNIERARELEEEGVHVVYGMPGLKTHCKCCLVVRREAGGLKQYAHLGTGNYNPVTSRTYTDFGLLTANPEITQEVAALFNTLTGFTRSPKFKKLLLAPFNLHQKMQEYILNEAKNALAGKPSRIIVKINSLVDEQTINNLYEASKAGVKIDLIVRGICCLVPGVKGLSENITVRSILGRFLEHSRIYYFENYGGESIVYVGSADWMPRNFFRRVEVAFPIETERLKKRIIDEIIPALLKDNKRAQVLKSNGKYVSIPLGHKQAFSAQDFFIKNEISLSAP